MQTSACSFAKILVCAVLLAQGCAGRAVQPAEQIKPAAAPVPMSADDPLAHFVLHPESVAGPAPPETTGTPLSRPPTLRPPAAASAPVAKPAPPVAAPPAAQGKRIVVRKFEFRGNTLFTAAQLEALIAEYLNRPISLDDIYSAADKAARSYHEKGYSLASVDLPAQAIGDGTVRLEVIEGRLTSTEITGNRSYRLDQLQDYLGSFGTGGVYQAQELESRLLRLNQLPGLSTRAVLKPGADYGTSQLLIEATEQPYTASLAADNHGRENLGELRSSLTFGASNPLQAEDQFQMVAVHSEQNRLNYGFAQYSLPLLKAGPRLTFAYGQAEFELSGTFAGIAGRNRNGRVGLNWPLILSRAHEVSAGLGASRSLTNSDLAGNPISATQVTLYETSLFWHATHGSGAATQLLATLSSNFSKSADVPREDQRLRVELDLQRLQPLLRRLDGYVRLDGVYSPDPLPEISQFSLGGPSSVRAYPASEVRGDRGLFGTAGLRSSIRAGSSVFTGRVFVDAGTVRRLDVTTSEQLDSAGLGLDWHWGRSAYGIAAKADWSFPTSSYTPPGETRGSRLFASLSLSYR